MDAIEAVGTKIKTNKAKKKVSSSQIKTSYLQKEVDLNKTPILFFPPGKEMLFLGIYFITLPYITGLLFLFFYVAKAKAAIFSSLDESSSFFLVWMVGYEILATVVILWIMKNAVSYSIKASQAAHRAHKKTKQRYKRF